MLYYTYKIVFLKGEHKGCYYIGKRSTKKYSSFEKDPYTGSGLFCLRYFKKWGKVSGETYTKELLLTASSDEENSSNEARLIGDLWKTDDKCMNLAAGGAGWKYDHYGENNPNWGKHPSEETRKKIGEASKGRQAMLGHHHSEESKKKMSEHNAARRPEVRAKISAAHKRRQELLRAQKLKQDQLETGKDL